MWGCARRCCPNAPTMVYKCAWHSAGARGGPLPTRGIVPVLQTPAPRPAQEGTASVPRMLTPSRQIDSQPLWGRRSGRFLCLRQRFPAKTPSGQPISGPKRGRKPGPFLETSSLVPPLAALRCYTPLRHWRFRPLTRPKSPPLPRKRVASSASGSASPLST